MPDDLESVSSGPMTVDDVVELLEARAAELERRAAEHRAAHDRRESKSVRAKLAAQVRELRRAIAGIRTRQGA